MLSLAGEKVTELVGGQPRFIDQYIPLVEFLGQAMGPNVEVVLHDLDFPDRSIIAIANNNISGREIGGPVTDFALWFMKQGDAEQVPMMTGYRAVNSEGRMCHSSSYFLRDSNNIMRGMLCVNVDISDWLQVRGLVSGILGGFDSSAPDKTEAFGGYPGKAPVTAPVAAPSIIENENIHEDHSPEQVTENLRSDVENLLESMFDKAVSQYTVPPERLQREERRSIIKSLDEAGFFLLKGGIIAAAKRLGVSEPTVYRDLVHVRD